MLSDLSPGLLLGRFRLIEPIGRGGMGEVWRAIDPRLEREVAVKTLPAEFAADLDRVARFAREARALAALNHPAIAQIYEVGEDFPRGEDGKSPDAGPMLHYLAMELVTGETLAAKIARDGPIPIHDVLRISRQVATALEAAHDKGIIHRDLKPGNIMLAPDGAVKVLDFGLSRRDEKLARVPSGPSGKLTDPKASSSTDSTPTRRMGPNIRETETGVILGTTSYMSPEQARGRNVDGRTDLWAFGCCLHEMLTGAKAFSRDTPLDTIAAILRDDPIPVTDLRPETPAPLVDLVAGCLKKNPDDRVSTAQEARLRLVALLADQVPLRPLAKTKLTAKSDLFLSPAQKTLASLALLLLLVGLVIHLRLKLGSSGGSRGDGSSGGIGSVTPLLVGSAHEGDLVWSPDGSKRLYVSDRAGSWDLWMDDGPATPPRRLTATPVFENTPAWSPDGREVVFAREEDNAMELWSLELSTGHEKKLLDDGLHPTFSPDGTKILIVQSAGGFEPAFLATYARATGDVTRVTASEAGCRPMTPGWSPDGSRIAWISQNSLAVAELRVARADGSSMKTIWKGERVENAATTWLPSGNALLLAVSRGPATELFRVPDDGSTATAIRTLRERIVSIHFSPDGKRASLTAWNTERDFWEFDASGQRTRRLTSDGWVVNWPAWSPTSDRIAFATTKEGGTRLWIQSLDGSELRPLTSGHPGESQVDWSPDGREIVYSGKKSGEGTDLFVIPALGGSARSLTDDRFTDARPVWSPDGTRVAFLSDRSGQSEIWVISATGGTPKQVTRQKSAIRAVAWHPPTGRLIYRQSGKPGGGDEIHMIGENGQGDRVIGKPIPLAGDQLSLSPDGRAVVVRYPYPDLKYFNFGRLDLESGRLTPLTRFVGGDLENPSRRPDGGSFAALVTVFQGDVLLLEGVE